MTTSLEKQLEATRRKEQDILSQIKEERKHVTIPCVSCKKPHKIKDLTLIQTRYYVRPHGCTEGDYWLDGELQFPCPQTNEINRLLFDNCDVPYEERERYENNPQEQFKREYGPSFKEIIEVADDNHAKQPKHINNFYVDRNRQEYGLVARRT